MKKCMKLFRKYIFCFTGVFILFFSINTQSYAAICNSPCPNPCTPSRTVCEGINCTTYCNSTSSIGYSAVYYNAPTVSFSYTTPNTRFSISNEVYGLHNYYRRPNIIISNGFRPVYHKIPGHSINKIPQGGHIHHKPPKKPAPRNFHKTVQAQRRH